MKIDFEVNERKLGRNLQEFNFMEDDSTLDDNQRITWGQEAWVIAQVEIAEFDAFPDIEDGDENIYARAVVGRINGQVYATTLVYNGCGIYTGIPMLIEELSYERLKYRGFLIEECGMFWTYTDTKPKIKNRESHLANNKEECISNIDSIKADAKFSKQHEKMV